MPTQLTIIASCDKSRTISQIAIDENSGPTTESLRRIRAEFLITPGMNHGCAGVSAVEKRRGTISLAEIESSEENFPLD